MQPALTVLDDPPAVARHVATWLAQELGAGPPGRRAVALSGGSTPRLLYETLARAPWRDAMPWERIHWFWCDERFVPAADERSNYELVRRLLLDEAPIPRANIHPIPTASGTPESAAAAYDAALRRYYGADTLAADRPLFDVVLLGVGEDGHTASLFPGSALLNERSRWAAAEATSRPEPRITLTYPALESSRATAFIVTGASKRAVVGEILGGASDAPAARLRPAGGVHWFVDRAAAAQEGG